MLHPSNWIWFMWMVVSTSFINNNVTLLQMTCLLLLESTLMGQLSTYSKTALKDNNLHLDYLHTYGMLPWANTKYLERINRIHATSKHRIHATSTIPLTPNTAYKRIINILLIKSRFKKVDLRTCWLGQEGWLPFIVNGCVCCVGVGGWVPHYREIR